MREPRSRPGPAAEVWSVERFLRKRRFLEKDERLLELKHGRVRRWLVDGSDQKDPKFRGLERIPFLSGTATLSYSSRCLFFVGMHKFAVTDLSLIARIWCAAPQSVCVIYATFEDESARSLASIRWDADGLEGFDDIVAFADRIRAAAKDRRAQFSADWQSRFENRVAEIAGSASFESQLAELDEAAAAAVGLRPRTVVGMWFRAVCNGFTNERDRLAGQLNGGEPGWNEDEPGVLQAASELAARRYFGPKANVGEIAATAAQIVEAERRGADLAGRGGGLPDKSYVQAVITSASGNHDPGLQNMPPRVAFEIRGAFIIFVVMTLDIMFELDTLICDAEALAFERGLSPQLVGVQPR
jgi:hypothetical protein